MSSATKKYMIRTLEDELETFDKVADQATELRNEIINVSMTAVRKIDMDKVEVLNPDDAQSVSKVLSTALKAVSDQESTAVRRINAKIKQADQKRADGTSELVVDLYRKMASGQPMTNMPAVNLDTDLSKIDKEFTLAGGDISETELRDNPKDYS